MNYKEAKKKGFKYITRDIIGGECAHKEVPVRNNGYWYSKGWHYITTNGHVCKSKEDIMDIDTAIVLSRTKRPIEEIAIAEGHMVFIKSCPICNTIFETTRNNKVYCSHSCAIRANNKRIAENKPVDNCIECGRPFDKTTRSNCCSPECSYKRKLRKNEQYKKARAKRNDS